MVWKLSVSGNRYLSRNVMAAPAVAPVLSAMRHGQKPPELAGIGFGQICVTGSAGQAPVVVVSVAAEPLSRSHWPPGRSSSSRLPLGLAFRLKQKTSPLGWATWSESVTPPHPSARDARLPAWI